MWPHLKFFLICFCLFIKCAMATLYPPSQPMMWQLQPTRVQLKPPTGDSCANSCSVCSITNAHAYNSLTCESQKVNNRNANRLLLLLLLQFLLPLRARESANTREREREHTRERAQSANYSCLCYVYYYSTTISNSCYCSFGQAEATRH